MTFTELLERFGIPHRDHPQHEHCRPGWTQLDCPYCSAGWGHFRLGYNIRRKYFSCWSCGGVRFIETLRLLLDRPFHEIKSLAESITSGRVSDYEPPARGVYKPPPGVIGPLNGPQIAYVRGRGLDFEKLALWGVKGFSSQISTPTRFAWRLFIPFVWRGELVSWTTRSIAREPKIRYLSASPGEEKYDHKTLLGGEDLVPGHAVCAVEGPFDAFAIGPGAVWLSGTAYKRAQVLKLARYPVRVVCFDSSTEAQLRARKLVNELSAFEGCTYNVVLDSKDPGEASESELEQVRRLLK